MARHLGGENDDHLILFWQEGHVESMGICVANLYIEGSLVAWWGKGGVCRGIETPIRWPAPTLLEPPNEVTLCTGDTSWIWVYGKLSNSAVVSPPLEKLSSLVQPFILKSLGMFLIVGI